MTNKITLCVVIGILLLSAGIMFVKSYSSTPSVEDSIFIGERTSLYVLDGCSHCKIQTDLFRENIKYLNVIDCYKEENRNLCFTKGIDTFPTWEIDQNKYVGVKSVKQLKELISKNYLRDIDGNITLIPNSSLGKSCPLNIK
ncbi:hypothetical protein M0R19_01990 [Candidatus Pacearchaeota archaeon]|nr:hypothetical protein [Candidatus Pacearchaeota archaeon]